MEGGGPGGCFPFLSLHWDKKNVNNRRVLNKVIERCMVRIMPQSSDKLDYLCGLTIRKALGERRPTAIRQADILLVVRRPAPHSPGLVVGLMSLT